MEPIIETKGLCKRYGDKEVLHDVNLQVYPGDILGLVGKNGAGKTTLIRVLTDVAHPSGGSFTLFGEEDPRKQVILRRKIAAMVETPAFYGELSGERNLISRLILLEKSGDLQAQAEELLRFVGLDEVIGTNKKARDYSLGMRQRLGIAMALSGEPELLILDEPTNGLDPAGILQIRELLLRTNREKGVTILISSHILGELSKLATRYAFLDEGHVVQEITAAQLEGSFDRSVLLFVSDEKKALELLRKQGYTAEKGPEGIVCYGYKEVIEPLKALLLGGVDVTHFKETVTDLEEYFVSLLNEEGK
ncbi:MAG: ABC transporter ATP-binding protein [Erysipelotrichaceae bacterium]|nr:ABC transporter ATP-binding protein [Erysipelotrichaceae bacterium]